MAQGKAPHTSHRQAYTCAPSVLPATLRCPGEACQPLSRRVRAGRGDTLPWLGDVATWFFPVRATVFSPLSYNILYIISRLLMVILSICDIFFILTLPQMSQIFTLRCGFPLFDLARIHPYLLFWLVLETRFLPTAVPRNHRIGSWKGLLSLYSITH